MKKHRNTLMTPVNTNNQYERWVKTTSEVLSKHIHLMVEIKNIALVVRRNIVFTVFREHRIFDILMKKTTVEVKSLQLAARIAVPAWNSVGGVGVSCNITQRKREGEKLINSTQKRGMRMINNKIHIREE